MSQPVSIILEGTAQAEQSKSYIMLPFTVPQGVTKLHVSYEYNAQIGSDPQLAGGNTVDIGIFDTQGHDFMGAGFRGWSGSARNAFEIGLHQATPGYMPGPIQAGEWAICLGAYKIAEQGCHYKVTVTFSFSEELVLAQFPMRLQLSDVPQPRHKHANGWYKGELHCHTYHSDGDSDPLQVVRYAEALSLDFLAITDHNILSHQTTLQDIDTSLMLIPGMEVTTYQGHWNIWGAGDWIDFRVLQQKDMEAAVASAREQGYFISCNHPKPHGPEWAYPAITDFDCIEVWNGPWMFFNIDALKYWKKLLDAGQRITAVGGSDSHFHLREHPAKLAHPTTVIYCDGAPSPLKLLQSLRAGHAFITESPQGPQIFLNCGGARMGDTAHITSDEITLQIQVMNGVGKQLELWSAKRLHVCTIDTLDWQQDITIPSPTQGYIFAQLTTGDDEPTIVHALTNPIYFEASATETGR